MNMKLETQRAGGSSQCTFTNNPKHTNDQWFWHRPLFTFIKIWHHQKSLKWNQKHYIAVWTFLHNRNDSRRQPWTYGSYRQHKTQRQNTWVNYLSYKNCNLDFMVLTISITIYTLCGLDYTLCLTKGTALLMICLHMWW